MSNEMIFAILSMIVLAVTDLALIVMARLLKTIQFGIETMMDMMLTLSKMYLCDKEEKERED